MSTITLGVDLAKSVFSVCAMDGAGHVLERREFKREAFAVWLAQRPAGTVVAMEACSGAHHWARRCEEYGLQPRLMAAQLVKPYRKSQRSKNDRNDAEAIATAARQGNMRFVPIKDVDQQSVLMLHRARALLIRQRTMLVNALRAHMAEFGFIAAQGLRNVEQLIAAISDAKTALTELARSILQLIVAQLNDTAARIRLLEARLAKWHRTNGVSRLLASVPGVGIMGASAIAATVTDPSLFRSGREFAAWLGMTPRQNSSGGKERLGGISKRGDKYIRSLLIGKRRFDSTFRFFA